MSAGLTTDKDNFSLIFISFATGLAVPSAVSDDGIVLHVGTECLGGDRKRSHYYAYELDDGGSE